MNWRKIQSLNLVKLGALNGLVLGLIITVPLALYCLFDKCKSSQGCDLIGGGYLLYSRSCFCDTVNWWLPLELSLLVAAVGFLAQITFAKHLSSTILVWQAIGFVSAIESYFYFAIRFILENWHSCFLNWGANDFCTSSFLLDELFRQTKPDFENIIKFAVLLSVLLIFNLLFALTLSRRNQSLP